MDEQELYHYGVLGMKWGVRKNPSKAYGKAEKKRQKLQSKAASMHRKADTKAYIASGKISRSKTKKQLKKNSKKLNQALQLNFKSERLQRKAIKWEKQMDKVFKDYEINRIEQKTILKGKKFTYELTRKKSQR